MRGKIKDNILKYAEKWKYFDIDGLRGYLKKQEVEFNSKSLKTRLYPLRKQEILYGAGRGWYSIISKEFKLITKPVEKIVNLINERFPDIKFFSWGTEQLKEFYHHIPFHFIAFIYTEREFMVYLKELLESEGFNVYENPLKREAEKFLTHKENTVILRPLVISRGSIGGSFSKIEKILVDLYMERQKVNLMDEEEYKRILSEILTNYRINMAEMLDYAHNRKIRGRIVKLLQELNIIPMRHFGQMSQK